MIVFIKYIYLNHLEHHRIIQIWLPRCLYISTVSSNKGQQPWLSWIVEFNDCPSGSLMIANNSSPTTSKRTLLSTFGIDNKPQIGYSATICTYPTLSYNLSYVKTLFMISGVNHLSLGFLDPTFNNELTHHCHHHARSVLWWIISQYKTICSTLMSISSPVWQNDYMAQYK